MIGFVGGDCDDMSILNFSVSIFTALLSRAFAVIRIIDLGTVPLSTQVSDAVPPRSVVITTWLLPRRVWPLVL